MRIPADAARIGMILKYNADMEARMPLTDYNDSFINVQNNLTEWIKIPDGKLAVVKGDEICADTLAKLRAELSDGGIIAAAADNRYSLAGFAGADYFDKNGAACTREQLIDIALEAGFAKEKISMYYPYPDCRLPVAIYSDGRLPECGELTDNYRNFYSDRLYIFDESEMWDRIISDKKFTEFANSFLMLLDCTDDASCNNGTLESMPVFVKYSDDRAAKYRICTEIYRYSDGGVNERYTVRKRAIGMEAEEHIRRLAQRRDMLLARFEGFERETGIKIDVNRCVISGSAAEFEYLPPNSLESVLLELSRRGDYDGLRRNIEIYAKLVRYNLQSGVLDIDLLFKNIFVSDDEGVWTIIDYEWTWDISELNYENKYNYEEIADYIIQRSVYYFITDNRGVALGGLDIYKLTHTSEPVLPNNCYALDNEFERQFQAEAAGEYMTLGRIYEKTHGRIYDVGRLVALDRRREAQDAVSVDNMEFDDMRVGESHEITIYAKDADRIVLYPAHCCCFVYLKGTSEQCGVRTNGIRLTKRLYAFMNTNPAMTFSRRNTASGNFTVNMFVSNQGDNDSPVFEAVVKAFSFRARLLYNKKTN